MLRFSGSSQNPSVRSRGSRKLPWLSVPRSGVRSAAVTVLNVALKGN